MKLSKYICGMKTKLITPKEYAASKKCTPQNIHKKIKSGRPLEDVINIKQFDRFYLLEVPQNYEL